MGGGGERAGGGGALMQNTLFLCFCENVSFSAGGGLSQKFSSVGILCSDTIFWSEYTVLYPGKPG